MPVPTFGAGLLRFCALGGEADFGEAQEDQAEDGRGVFLGLETGVGAELVGGVPEPFFQGGGGGVLSGWGDREYGLAEGISDRINRNHNPVGKQKDIEEPIWRVWQERVRRDACEKMGFYKW